MSNPSVKNERKKPKLVRDSFTIPKSEYAAIDTLKTRAIALGSSVKKSELLRAGLLALQAMTDAQFKLAIGAVPQLKTGRPAADTTAAPASPAPSTTNKAVTPAKPKLAKARAVSKPAGKTAPAPTRPAAAPTSRAAAKPATRVAKPAS